MRGQPLIQAEEPFLATRVAMLIAQLEELAAKYDALLPVDRVQAAMVREEMIAVEANLRRARERQAELVFRSPASGQLHRAATPPTCPGRFVNKGQLVGYVVEPRELTARVALLQDDIAMVRQNTRGVEVMLAGWGSQPGAGADPPRGARRVSLQLPTAGAGQRGRRPDRGRSRATSRA